MAYWKCLGCELVTGRPELHTVCPKSGSTVTFEVCTCGSGGHPRPCALHPGRYDEHVAELNADAEDE